MQTEVQAMYRRLKARLDRIVPDFELRLKAELAVEIERLKQERNAVILGHNYMEPALYHSICDFVGDSLELSRRAAETDKDVIVFCGVKFMAETAKILSPQKTVLLPSQNGGCSLASGITAEDVRNLKKQFPGVPVVTYVNTYADVKAETDVCCTSGNAAEVVRSLNSAAVIFLPDEFLGRNVARETQRSFHLATPDLTPAHLQRPCLIGWKARCEVHERFTLADVTRAREHFPGVAVLAHPECPPEVTAAADFAGSTMAMVRFVKESKAPRFLLLTECSMADNIIAENPDKEMVRMCSLRCPHMNEITMQDTLESLRQMRYVIEVPEDIRVRAHAAVARMIAIRGGTAGYAKK
ncbi:MAG: quinolinate synthase NadA [Kiritimatiellaeota bacterium]|nr:quinolinate synthase NadA [Kiritimatiellota bacterium]